jgi:hypothetical protein
MKAARLYSMDFPGGEKWGVHLLEDAIGGGGGGDVSYCFISINNRLLVVKCYSNLVVSGFPRNEFNSCILFIFIVSLPFFLCWVDRAA